jgi:hypothetical protein
LRHRVLRHEQAEYYVNFLVHAIQFVMDKRFIEGGINMKLIPPLLNAILKS